MQLAHRVIVLSGSRIVGTSAQRDITEDKLISLSHNAETEKGVTLNV